MSATFKTTKDFLYTVQKSKDKMGTALTDLILDRKNVLDLNILVCVDVSGSISAQQFRDFMWQIDSIRGLSRVKVLEVDTEVVAMYDYFRTAQSRVIRLGGGGGTCFAKAFDKAKQMEPDAILFMTDGFVFGDKASDPGIQTGWVLTQNGQHPYGFGEVVLRLPAPSESV